jgi:hypothetical protein
MRVPVGGATRGYRVGDEVMVRANDYPRALLNRTRGIVQLRADRVVSDYLVAVSPEEGASGPLLRRGAGEVARGLLREFGGEFDLCLGLRADPALQPQREAPLVRSSRCDVDSTGR